jgi:hypothetical protein
LNPKPQRAPGHAPHWRAELDATIAEYGRKKRTWLSQFLDLGREKIDGTIRLGTVGEGPFAAERTGSH